MTYYRHSAADSCNELRYSEDNDQASLRPHPAPAHWTWSAASTQDYVKSRRRPTPAGRLTPVLVVSGKVGTVGDFTRLIYDNECLCRCIPNSTNRPIPQFRYVATIPRNGILSTRKKRPNLRVRKIQCRCANLGLELRREGPRFWRAG